MVSHWAYLEVELRRVIWRWGFMVAVLPRPVDYPYQAARFRSVMTGRGSRTGWFKGFGDLLPQPALNRVSIRVIWDEWGRMWWVVRNWMPSFGWTGCCMSNLLPGSSLGDGDVSGLCLGSTILIAMLETVDSMVHYNNSRSLWALLPSGSTCRVSLVSPLSRKLRSADGKGSGSFRKREVRLGTRVMHSLK